MPRLTFEQWVAGIFDHPVASEQWYWRDDADDCFVGPTANAEYIYRLFSDCAQPFLNYSDDQVGQGLWMMASITCSDHARSMVGEDAPQAIRWRAIQSIVSLNENCFAKRCRDCLGSNGGANQLEMTCYMWWDLFPAWCDPSDPSQDIEALEYIRVMEKCLAIEHAACQQGALHGLGHWVHRYPKQIEPVIDCFLRSRNKLRPDLLQYALNARKGMVQ